MLIDFVLIILILKNSRFVEHSISRKRSRHFRLIYCRNFRDNLTDFLDFNYYHILIYNFDFSRYNSNNFDIHFLYQFFIEIKYKYIIIDNHFDEFLLIEYDVINKKFLEYDIIIQSH